MEKIIYNAPDTADLLPEEYGCSSWREYWEKNGGDKKCLPNKIDIRRGGLGIGRELLVRVYRCPSCGEWVAWDRMAPDCFDGCHVNIHGDASGQLYITPMCHACNQKDISVSIDESMLIPVE